MLDELAACRPEELSIWIDHHRAQINFSFLQQIKDTYADFSLIIAQPQLAERLTSYALVIAQQLPHELLALPLAHWARGLWCMVHAPQAAIDHFQSAIIGYEQWGDQLSVGRLTSNLVGIYAECGRFAEAECAYYHAHPIFVTYADEHPYYLLVLEQNYGWLLHQQGKYEQALNVHERALAIAIQHSEEVIANEIRVNRTRTFSMLGRFNEAEAQYLADRLVAQGNGQALTVARIDMNLGELYIALGRPAAALQQFHCALTAFIALGNEMETGSVALRMAQLLQQIGSLETALRYYTKALTIFSQYELQPQVGKILVDFAGTQRLVGEYKHAGNLLERAEQLWHNLAYKEGLFAVLRERIELALERNDGEQALSLVTTILHHLLPEIGNVRINAEVQLLLAETLRQLAEKQSTEAEGWRQGACTAYEEARSYAQEQGNRWLLRRTLIGLGKLWQTIAPEKAQDYLAEAVALDDTIRQTLSVEELKAGYHARTDDLFVTLLQLALAQQQLDQALLIVWKWKSGAILELVQSVAIEHEETMVEQQAIEQVRQQLAVYRWQLTRQANDQIPDVVREQTHPELAKLEEQLLELRRKSNRLVVNHQWQVHQTPSTLLAAMDADLLIEYICCNDHLFGIAVDHSGVQRIHQLADVETIATLLGRLHLRFQRVTTQPIAIRQTRSAAWTTDCLPLLAKCYDRLVRPLLTDELGLSTAGSAIKHVLIAPCAPLFLAPFAAFWDGSHFWTETCQLEMIQSGGMLALASQKNGATSPPLIVAASTGAMHAVRAEALQVAAALPSSITYLDTPVLDHLRQLKAPPRLLHFAAHSLIRDDAPLFSGLQLTGEVLAVEACYDLPLAGTELVVLSSCATAAGLESDAMLLAFQSAFFVAGAARVLASLWPISDDAPSVWMAHFYRHLTAGCPVAEAIQRTQHTLLRDPAYAHPAIWAAFAVSRRA
ncbi:MAG: CHAT domain-containing tetratricopeptide repeat protein [Caldilineaceae bacterium]